MAKKVKKFIQGAIKRPGKLTRRAEKAKMSIYSYAQKHQHDGGLAGDESRFYLNVLRPAAANRKKRK